MCERDERERETFAAKTRQSMFTVTSHLHSLRERVNSSPVGSSSELLFCRTDSSSPSDAFLTATLLVSLSSGSTNIYPTCPHNTHFVLSVPLQQCHSIALYLELPLGLALDELIVERNKEREGNRWMRMREGEDERERKSEGERERRYRRE